MKDLEETRKKLVFTKRKHFFIAKNSHYDKIKIRVLGGNYINEKTRLCTSKI